MNKINLYDFYSLAIATTLHVYIPKMIKTNGDKVNSDKNINSFNSVHNCNFKCA